MSLSQKAVVKENQDFGTKKLPYEAPYAYFENLPNKVWEKAQGQPKVVFWMQPAFRFGVASLMVLSLAWWIWKPVSNQEAMQDELNALATVEIADYLLTHSDLQGMVLMAQAEPFIWDGTLPGQVTINAEEAWSLVDESEILTAWEEI